MFLALEPSDGDKSTSLYARNLAFDEKFSKETETFLDEGAERPLVNYVVQDVNKQLGKHPHKLFPMLFNQFSRKGTTGWEYGSEDYRKIVLHALNVAQRLGAPLHVNAAIMEKVMMACINSNIKFDFDLGEPVKTVLGTAEMERINERLANRQYMVLKDVFLPQAQTPE